MYTVIVFHVYNTAFGFKNVIGIGSSSTTIGCSVFLVGVLEWWHDDAQILPFASVPFIYNRMIYTDARGIFALVEPLCANEWLR